jgi:hypothetical protein
MDQCSVSAGWLVFGGLVGRGPPGPLRCCAGGMEGWRVGGMVGRVAGRLVDWWAGVLVSGFRLISRNWPPNRFSSGGRIDAPAV